MTLRPALRDATLVTVALSVAVWAGSGAFMHLDPALLGYLGATIVAAFGTTYRVSAFWRRPASAFYARALGEALRDPRRLRAVLADAGRDLAAQRFIARRSRLRWAAHLSLSFGTLASFAITVPLVFGWMRFDADGQDVYRLLVAGWPVGRFAIAGAVGWGMFHALSLSGVAVVAGALYFLGVRLRARRLPAIATTFHVGPLLLLLAVAATGLALPATRDTPAAFRIAALSHEITVVALLVALPFSKLAHVLIRPLHLGAQVVRARGALRSRCIGCDAVLAPTRQVAAVERLLVARGFRFDGHQQRCQACRRRQVASAQATLLDAHFHPPLTGARPAPPRRRERAA